jgi:molecular chaperone GrpE
MNRHQRNHEREGEVEKEEKKPHNGDARTGLADEAKTGENGTQGTGRHDDQAGLPEDVKTLRESLKTREEESAKRKEELDQMKDLMLRRQADFDNYKKRMVKSQDEYRKLAIKDMSLDIIQINDDILRALEAAACVDPERLPASHSSFIDGVSMISRRIEEMLTKYGVKEIESLNREFDPSVNEAVEITESGEVTRDTITKVYQKGFTLDENVVRAARVRVTRPSRNSPPEGTPAGEGACGSGAEGVQQAKT